MTQLKPHLFFNGQCLEAINFYMDIFKGEIETFEKYKDGPIQVNKADENKIMFAEFSFPGGSFFASDDLNDTSKINSNIVLTIQMKNEEELPILFDKLAKNGSILTAATPSFLGETTAEVIDQFGIRWRLYT